MKRKLLSLALETSADYLGIALHRFALNEKPHLLARRFTREPAKQSDHLIPAIDSLLKKKRIKKNDLSLVSVNCGPGSFTGIRVGVAAARAISQGLKIPAVGICGLEAMAQLHARSGKIVVVSLPALAGETYYAAYQMGTRSKVLIKPSWGTISEFNQAIKKYQSQQPLFVHNENVLPETIGLLAMDAFLRSKRQHRLTFNNLVPLYLQPSWAERKKI